MCHFPPSRWHEKHALEVPIYTCDKLQSCLDINSIDRKSIVFYGEVCSLDFEIGWRSFLNFQKLTVLVPQPTQSGIINMVPTEVKHCFVTLLAIALSKIKNYLALTWRDAMTSVWSCARISSHGWHGSCKMESVHLVVQQCVSTAYSLSCLVVTRGARLSHWLRGCNNQILAVRYGLRPIGHFLV